MTRPDSYFDDENILIGILVFFAIAGAIAFYVRHRQTQGDAGLGDTVAHLAKTVGIQQTPECGCAARQAAMNGAVPYS
jgi:hypothetical protein